MSRMAINKWSQSNLREQKVYFHSWLITDIRRGTIFSVNILDDNFSVKKVLRIFKWELTHTYIVSYYVTYEYTVTYEYHKNDFFVII